MPASYAHYRFGKQVLPQLPGDVRQCIQRFRRMFDMGLNGPDIFYYFNPFFATATGELGSTFHLQSGQEFFPAACAAATSEAARAYLYGLLGHYCLDSRCHPYVRQLVDIGEANHARLESEFERFLLLLDKHPSPQTFHPGKRMKTTRGECMTISGFYPPATGGAVSLSIQNMAISLRFLAAPNRKRNEAILSKVNPSLLDYMIPAEDSESLAPYVRELKALYDEAIDHYPVLLAQLTEHLRTGAPPGNGFAPNSSAITVF